MHDGKFQYQSNTLNPVWPEMRIQVLDLCNDGNLHKPFLINVWDYDFECPNDDFMGFCGQNLILSKLMFAWKQFPFSLARLGISGAEISL